MNRICLLSWMMVCIVMTWPARAMANADGVNHARPIDWVSFKQRDEASEHFITTRTLLNHSLRYNLRWCERDLKQASDGRYRLPNLKEHGVRPTCSVIYTAATAIKTGGYDAETVGLSEAEAMNRLKKMIHAVVDSHKANLDTNTGWGNDWQSALWASLAGMGGWMVWDDLTLKTRRKLTVMITYEADRFIVDDYRVPYWNGKGGDSKSEENSWNSMIVTLASAMMPEHPHREKWKNAATQLILGSYCRESDWKTNDRLVEGKPIRDWLNGYNMREDGVVINHNFIHPDYMGAISMNFWGLTAHRLAGQKTNEAWDFNAALVYGAFVHKNWPSPPFEQPGGTIYQPGKAKVYYPKGTDWSYVDFSLYYLMDVYADLFHWNDAAGQWVKLRSEAMIEMQKRHEDKRMFAKGEYDTYPGAEQWVAWCLADSYLPLWLRENGLLTAK